MYSDIMLHIPSPIFRGGGTVGWTLTINREYNSSKVSNGLHFTSILVIESMAQKRKLWSRKSQKRFYEATT
jgi:hypothetical protein